MRNWYKMDFGFWRDEKVRYLTAIAGEAAAYRYFKLVALAYEYGTPRGVLDLDDRCTRITILEEMRMDFEELDELVSDCVEVGLFSDIYKVNRKVSSERMVEQGQSIDAAIESARNAGKASAEARRKKARAKVERTLNGRSNGR